MSEDQPQPEDMAVQRDKQGPTHGRTHHKPAHLQRPPIWSRPVRPPQSQRPSLAREQIVRAAIELADAEGLEALTMRRLAQKLGAGAMSLYWHVPNKDDLLDLMLDTAFGEVELPEQPALDWRADLRLFARHMLGVLRRHTWLPSLISSRPLPSPNRLRYVERLLAELAGLGLDFNTIGGILNTVEAYVDGFAQHEVSPEEIRRRTGMAEAEWRATFTAYLQQILSSGQYPTVARLIVGNAEITADATFEFGLDCVLDGIAARIATTRRDGSDDTLRATSSAQE
jgi:AcrR family transcriptional regulator